MKTRHELEHDDGECTCNRYAHIKVECGCEKDVFACREHAHPKPQHTPGLTIEFKNTPITLNEYYEINRGLETLCIVEKVDETESSDCFMGSDIANARLIACAPELLLAVEGYALYLKTDGRESTELAELINRAKGRK